MLCLDFTRGGLASTGLWESLNRGVFELDTPYFLDFDVFNECNISMRINFDEHCEM